MEQGTCAWAAEQSLIPGGLQRLMQWHELNVSAKLIQPYRRHKLQKAQQKPFTSEMLKYLVFT